jgi:hypothetical protein
VLALRVRRLDAQVTRLLASSDPIGRSATPHGLSEGSPDVSVGGEEQPGYVITRVGEPEPALVSELVSEPVSEPVPTVPAPVFADLVLKETVVQTASLFHGLRRALSPEIRNRIRFHVRQEVKRSRKQRRAELREVRREWAARQRAAMTPDGRAGESAA